MSIPERIVSTCPECKVNMDGRVAILDGDEADHDATRPAITVCPHCLSVLVFRTLPDDRTRWMLDTPTQAEWQCLVRLDIIQPAIHAIGFMRKLHLCDHPEQVEPDWVRMMARFSD